MSFYIAKTIQEPFDTAIDKVTAALKEEASASSQTSSAPR